MLGWPFPKRRDYIDKIRKSNSASDYPLKFQGKIQRFPIFSIPIELPKYRLANGRTAAEQEVYIANNDSDEDFFKKDLESEDVHKVQHQILIKMLRSSNSDLINFFKKEKQLQPLILDNEGFVINGNRRLCAMRELYNDDRSKFEHFSHIEVVILPHCSEKDKDELEADLQIKKDIKADYTWIAEACMLRKRQKDHNYPDDELAQIYGMSIKELREKLDILNHVDAYLADRGIPKQYFRVEKAEFAFKQLKKGREKLKGKEPAVRDIFQKITYCMIDNPEETGTRIYQSIQDVSESLDNIIDELKDELPVAVNEGIKDSNIDLFGFNNNELTNLVVSINDPNNREIVLEITKDVIAREKAKSKEQHNASSVLRQVKDANSSLISAINCFNKKTITNGVNEQLDAIEQSVKTLRELLETGATTQRSIFS